MSHYCLDEPDSPFHQASPEIVARSGQIRTHHHVDAERRWRPLGRRPGFGEPRQAELYARITHGAGKRDRLMPRTGLAISGNSWWAGCLSPFSLGGQPLA